MATRVFADPGGNTGSPPCHGTSSSITGNNDPSCHVDPQPTHGIDPCHSDDHGTGICLSKTNTPLPTNTVVIPPTSTVVIPPTSTTIPNSSVTPFVPTQVVPTPFVPPFVPPPNFPPTIQCINGFVVVFINGVPISQQRDPRCDPARPQQISLGFLGLLRQDTPTPIPLVTVPTAIVSPIRIGNFGDAGLARVCLWICLKLN